MKSVNMSNVYCIDVGTLLSHCLVVYLTVYVLFILEGHSELNKFLYYSFFECFRRKPKAQYHI